MNGYTGKRTHQEVPPVHHFQGEATSGSHGEYHGNPSPGTSVHQLPVPGAREGYGGKCPGSNRPFHLLCPGICHLIPDGPNNSQDPLGQLYCPLWVTRENPFGPGEKF